MSELLKPDIQEIEATMEAMGYSDAKLIKAYPLFHTGRQVIRLKEKQGEDVVLKIRANNEAGLLEAQKIALLIDSYRMMDRNRFPSVMRGDLKDRIAIRMPFLGHSLYELAQFMDLNELGYLPKQGEDAFFGFSSDEIENMISQLSDQHHAFAGINGYVHGDLKLGVRSPSNVVYNPNTNGLLLIDGEALGPLSVDSLARFDTQISELRDWMHSNLTS